MSTKHLEKVTVDGLLALLDLISDPKKYKTAADNFTAWRKQQLEIIEQVSKVKDIESNLSKSRTELNQAKSIVEQAKVKAAKALELANKTIDAKNSDLAHRESVLDKDIKAFEKTRADHRADVHTREVSLEKRIKAVEAKEVEASTQMIEGQRLRKEFKSKVEQFKSIQ